MEELSLGEQLVGLDFNPSGDAKVLKVKQLCAELANLLTSHVGKKDTNTALELVIYNKAIADVLTAQMAAVKLLTFKY